MSVRLIGFAVVAVFLTVLVLGFVNDPFGWRKAKEHRQEVAAVQAQAETAEGAARALDTYHTQTIVIQKEAQREAEAVQSLPDANTPLAPDRRAALCAGLGRLRDDPGVCDDPGGR